MCEQFSIWNFIYENWWKCLLLKLIWIWFQWLVCNFPSCIYAAKYINLCKVKYIWIDGEDDGKKNKKCMLNDFTSLTCNVILQTCYWVWNIFSISPIYQVSRTWGKHCITDEMGWIWREKYVYGSEMWTTKLHTRSSFT